MDVITDIRIIVTKGNILVEKEITTIEAQSGIELYKYGSHWEMVPIETDPSEH